MEGIAKKRTEERKMVEGGEAQRKDDRRTRRSKQNEPASAKSENVCIMDRERVRRRKIEKE